MRQHRGERSGGRPLLPPAERRDRVLTVRMNAAERQIIWRRASLARLSAAAYARLMALRPSAPPRSVPIVNVRSYGQFGRLANNLNQLTRLAHEGRLPPGLLHCLTALLAEVRQVRRLLLGLDASAAAAAAAAGAATPAGEGMEEGDPRPATAAAPAPAAAAAPPRPEEPAR